jgi:hypothetical protein
MKNSYVTHTAAMVMPCSLLRAEHRERNTFKNSQGKPGKEGGREGGREGEGEGDELCPLATPPPSYTNLENRTCERS